MNALSLPLAFSIDSRKATGFRLPPDRYARVQDLAAQRGWSLQRFLDWCLDQVVELAFLTPANRQAVAQTIGDLQRFFPSVPWCAFDVINAALTQFFAEVRSGRLVLRAGIWQRNIEEKNERRVRRAATPENMANLFEAR